MPPTFFFGPFSVPLSQAFFCLVKDPLLCGVNEDEHSPIIGTLTYLLHPVRRLQTFLLQPLIQHAAGHRIRSRQLKFRLTGALLRNSLRQLGCGKPAGGVNLTV